MGLLSFSKELNQFSYSVNLQFNRMFLANNSYRNTPSLGFDLRWAEDSGNVRFLFGQHIRQRYTDTINQPNDSNISLLGAGYAFAIGDQTKTQGFVSAYGGGDRAVAERVDGNKRLVGLRGGLKHNINPELDANLNLGYQHGTYDKINPLFLVSRRYNFTEASASLVWQVAKPWSIKPSVSYFRSKSNIEIYTYDRTDASVTVRYAF